MGCHEKINDIGTHIHLKREVIIMDLSKITKLIPEFTLEDFNMFDIVTHAEWKKALNFESGIEEATFFMTMQSDKGYEVSLKFIKAYSVEVDLCGQIMGFCIEDKIKYGYAL